MVPFVALILSVVFISKTSTLGLPGSHFAILELHFGVPGSDFATLELRLGGLGLPRGLPRGPLESKVDF